MNKLFSILVCTAILLIHVSGARAQDPTYTIGGKAEKSGKTGQIHGVLVSCISLYNEKYDTEIYIPGTTFRASPNTTDPDFYYGAFDIHYVPIGNDYSLVIDFPDSEDTPDYTIYPIEVREGEITEFGIIGICRDLDNDGYTESYDCRDDDPLINPFAVESCSDTIDNNCDGNVNEECKPCLDDDQDGFKTGGGLQGDGTIFFCNANPRDCNDNNPLIRPIAEEVCDNLDNNCDGQVDEDFPLNTDLNCGACGVVCTYPDTCVAGVCSNQ